VSSDEEDEDGDDESDSKETEIVAKRYVLSYMRLCVCSPISLPPPHQQVITNGTGSTCYRQTLGNG
jgi:hypothetical protein